MKKEIIIFIFIIILISGCSNLLPDTPEYPRGDTQYCFDCKRLCITDQDCYVHGNKTECNDLTEEEIIKLWLE